MTPAQVETALDAGELVTLYQPCYDLRTGRLVAVEALARLRDPRTGRLLTPDQFLDDAERSGLVTRLDELMFEQATRQVARWRDLPAGRGLCVALNVSPADLDDPELLDGVVRMAGEAGLPLDALIIELTETLLSRTGRGHEQVLAELSSLGCNVTLDDFGTGNASFAYLQRFRVDGIKLDRSFVQLLGSGSPNERLVESLVRFCLSLGVHVVAEGIEEPGQVEALRRLGCPFGQGYLLGRPLPADAVEELLRVGDGRSPLLAPPPEPPTEPVPATTFGKRAVRPPGSGGRASQVLAALLALAVLGLTAFTVVGRARGEESLQRAAQSRVVTVDALAADQVDSELDGLRDLVTTYSRSTTVREAVASRRPRLMRSALRWLRSATSGLYSASVFDARGTLLGLEPGAPHLVGRNFAYRDWYLGARRSETAYVSEAFQLLTPAQPWAIAVSAAVRDPGGRVVGYVVATLALARIQDQLDAVRDQRGVALTLLDGHGTVLAAPDRRTVGRTTNDARLLAGSHGTGDSADEVQWAVRPVASVGGRLLAEQPTSAVLGRAETQGRRIAGMSLALAAVGLSLVLLWLTTDRRRRRLAADLQEAHDWATTVMTAAPTPVVVCDGEDRIQSANPAFAELLGVATATLGGQRLSSWVPIGEPAPTRGAASQAAVVTGEGEVRLVDVRTEVLSGPGGEVVRLHALVDVTPHREEQDRLRMQTRTDPLTGLGNRVALREALTAAVTRRARAALLMIDLDGFKAVNDLLGHDAGDELLCRVADVLRGAARTHDLVARVGGDEFVVLTTLDEGYERDCVGAVAELIRRPLQEALARQPGREVGVGVSVGAALVGPDGTDLRALLRVADERMYEAKRRGRGTSPA